MKKNIFAPDVRVIRFESADIVCSSLGDGSPLGGNPSSDSDNQRGGMAPGRTSIWD